MKGSILNFGTNLKLQYKFCFELFLNTVNLLKILKNIVKSCFQHTIHNGNVHLDLSPIYQ